MDLKELKRRRINKDLSQQELANKIGVDKMTYWRKENGMRDFNRTEIENISKVLGLSPIDIKLIFFNS
ncbi:Helix-turn-helix [Urinicoccus massiliensis]|uniref:Helix-turn-helix n=1 Tax=Urinicoccus massiliensis TaxID=1723382 RepID=A0A8H2M759_9FIRM|nr:helix-turn-helix transcriptional regulator [Urinicoccus massiliensis]VFB17228.1 Helix-turn-helix [Urinicoccus massiliensis]